METLRTIILQSSYLDKYLTENFANDSVIFSSMLDAFCKQYPTLSDEL